MTLHRYEIMTRSRGENNTFLLTPIPPQVYRKKTMKNQQESAFWLGNYQVEWE